MAELIVRRDAQQPAGATLARGVYQDQLDDGAGTETHRRLTGFSGKPGQVIVVPRGDGADVIVGLGRRGGLDATGLRHAVAAMVRACTSTDVVATTLLDDIGDGIDRADAARAIASSALSVRYRFDAHRSRPSTDGPGELVLLSADTAIDAVLDRAAVVHRGVSMARDLVNEPGGTLTPTEFARRCSELASPMLQVVVHDESAIRSLGMGGLLGVNSGSEEPPAFVELHYSPAATDRPRLALVGKGITYDSGGIMLKQKASSLLAMKNDMGGAAAVVGAMSVFAELGVPTPVSAFIPLTDNMGGGGAYRPGDVLRMYNGTTVEVVDTDAEGRLVLADALAYAKATCNAAAAVSVATLTGTAIHATGMEIAAVIARDQQVADDLLAASGRCSDRLWQLPRVPEYQFLLKSGIADMNNRAEAPAASSFAELFLESFVGDTPFAHIDMAAVATRDRDTPDGPAGGRGWGVELLVEYANAFGA